MSKQGCIKERKKEENDSFCQMGGGDDSIATSTKLLNIKYKFYGFSADVRETIN